MDERTYEAAISTPPPSTPALKKSTSKTQAAKNQKTILGFFQARTPRSTTSSSESPAAEISVPSQRSQQGLVPSQKRAFSAKTSNQLTPVPSSDAAEEADECPESNAVVDESEQTIGLPSPDTSANGDGKGKEEASSVKVTAFGTPSRRAKKNMSYAEPESDDEDEGVLGPTRRRPATGPSKRRKVSGSSEEDNYEARDDSVGVDDDDIDDFVVADDSDEEVRRPAKRKRSSKSNKASESSGNLLQDNDPDLDLDVPDTAVSTARQWAYDPEKPHALQPRSVNLPTKGPKASIQQHKQKPHKTDPDQRYTWLADLRDADRNRPGDPNYDPRTIYIPPLAWTNFSPFEKQYWEIKQKFWDTVVFFKKGKFYELYENDATIGHQLFDLKLTDRVNMRMVGVPEMSLDYWANQFVAKGFKIARVDQKETALGKDMRERDAKGTTAQNTKDKVIKRELASVLTAGTLVDGSMLQDDLSTYCVAIKESLREDSPAFGISFVDTATGQFHLTEFVDDAELTKFETFVAQTRPQELLLEKGSISIKALRILKNNTGPTTIWNYLKPGKEFWEAHITVKEIVAHEYFADAWPRVLSEAREHDLLMSSFGALMQYLRMLKIEQELISLGNFTWYDPIRKASSLVLDGQTLINLEVFANSYDGGPEGTLFHLLNRCVTPFGKRMFKQWVCHPLLDVDKINARLDAVDSLNADSSVRDRFTGNLSRMPDLERLISRIHAGSIKAQDFVRVLEGFEQIEYTISLLQDAKTKSNGDEGVIGQLITAMPDLASRLDYWKTAFDRTKATDSGILVPARGVEEDFDDSQDSIEAIQDELKALLKRCRDNLGSTAVCYKDVGKEIYQLEVPSAKVKKVPKGWDQMSATQAVKRYYFPELRGLVRKLQEAQETHSQIVKEVASRFYARFDENYEIWLASARIIAQLDCLISLAKASNSLGEPSCRPNFVTSERSVLDLQDLRHPCLVENISDFIPNDITLGGSNPSLNLLTGANAAGKSTVLRMTCTAVLMAQIGCYLPCSSATLTPFDRIMSRLGANDHIFAAQSTFFVELAETGKILKEATPRSLVILDELGRGTSSHDGVAVAQAVLWDLAGRVGCLGIFATHYHSLARDFEDHPEVRAMRMKIMVDEQARRVTFLYKLEDGVAEGSFGMHCASMCGIPASVVDRAEEAAREWEHTSKVGRAVDVKRGEGEVPLGVLSDLAWMLREGDDEVEMGEEEEGGEARRLEVLRKGIEGL
ncbi:MAG: hypothetical protein Q9227_004926 [Pyrenula ochraceoflavens]